MGTIKVVRSQLFPLAHYLSNVATSKICGLQLPEGKSSQVLRNTPLAQHKREFIPEDKYYMLQDKPLERDFV